MQKQQQFIHTFVVNPMDYEILHHQHCCWKFSGSSSKTLCIDFWSNKSCSPCFNSCCVYSSYNNITNGQFMGKDGNLMEFGVVDVGIKTTFGMLKQYCINVECGMLYDPHQTLIHILMCANLKIITQVISF